VLLLFIRTVLERAMGSPRERPGRCRLHKGLTTANSLVSRTFIVS